VKMGWHVYIAVVALITAMSLIAPTGGALSGSFDVIVGLIAIAAVGTSCARRRVGPRVLWLFLIAGIALDAGGTLVQALAGTTVADVLWLASYAAFAVGVGLFVRGNRQRSGRLPLIDAALVTTGMLVVAWPVLIQPLSTSTWVSQSNRIVAAFYALGDIALAVLLLHFAFDNRFRRPWFSMIVAAMVVFIAGNVVCAIFAQADAIPNVVVRHLLDLLPIGTYALIGAAAMHSSSDDAVEITKRRSISASTSQIAILTAASLSSLALLWAETLRGHVRDVPVIVAGSAILVILVVVRVVEVLRLVEAQTTRLGQMASTDALTSLPNRRTWEAAAERALQRSRRDGTPLSVAMIDLDFFKKFNDTHGHPAGDHLLRTAAAAWAAQLREIDMLARYGGEEFVALFVNASTFDLDSALARIAQVTPMGQTFSCGVATWNGLETIAELLQRADKALYEAKRRGRNRVVKAVPQSLQTPQLKIVG
jgi:diguanylate cyclase